MTRRTFDLSMCLLVLCGLAAVLPASAQTPVDVGGGSYASTLVAPVAGDSTYYGPSVSDMLSAYDTLYLDPSLKSKPIPTNHWWTDLMFGFRNVSSNPNVWQQKPFVSDLWVYPEKVHPTAAGMMLYYPSAWNARAANGSVSSVNPGALLQVDATTNGHAFVAPGPSVTSYGDWNISYSQKDPGGGTIRTNLCRGVPFVWARYTSTNPQIKVGSGNPVYDGNGNAIAVTASGFTASQFSTVIGGQTFGVYTAPNTPFTVSGNYLVPQLGTGGYVVYALLPNKTFLNQFAQYAYAMVTGTKMTWTYSHTAGAIQTTWTVTTSPLAGTNALTLQGWLPHHTRTTTYDMVFQPYTYLTARGTLQVAAGNTFHITWPFRGIAPMLPAPHVNGLPNDYQAARMQTYVSNYVSANHPGNGSDTYWEGKELGLSAQYMTMADQLGLTAQKTKLLTGIENVLSDWYTYTPGETKDYFAPLGDYGALIGAEVSYGSQGFNDNHFHYGYYAVATGLAGLEDPAWIANYGPMATMVAKEYANWERVDTRFPFLRTFDIWEGHSNAAGVSDGAGENQESSSEAMNSWVGLFLLGNATGDSSMVDAGAMGYTMESSAVNEYWQDWKHTNFPTTYGKNEVGILRAGQINYATYFSGDPAWIYCIQMVPVNHWNNYLTRDPAFAKSWLGSIFPERAAAAANGINGFTLSDANNDWSVFGNYPGDYIQGVQALYDPDTVAIAMDRYWAANQDIATANGLPGPVYYLAHTLRALGQQDYSYYTNVPTSAVYYNATTGIRAAVIFNPTGSTETATLYNSAGTVLGSASVPAHTLVQAQIGTVTAFSTSVPATATVGKPFTFTVTAIDDFGETIAGYAGTVRFQSSDPSAALPTSAKLTNGKGTFTATLNTAGSQTVTARDTVITALKGTSKKIAVTAASNSIYSVAVSSIPAPTGSGVMSFRVMNGTNGAYPDSQVYWCVLGQNPATGQESYLDLNGNLQPVSVALNSATGHLTKNGVNYANIFFTVSQKQWISLPLVKSGRIYLSVGTPCYIKTTANGFAGPDINNPTDPNSNVYFDFVEFTVDATGYHGNTTRVDMFGLPIQHRVVNTAGTYDRTVGELESETRSGIFTEYQNAVPSEFKSLATVQAPYRIVGPLHGSFAAGGANANYFASYTTVSTQDIINGAGGAATPQVCADLNRHVTTAQSAVVADYYQAAPANFYSKFWHTIGINGLAYGFPYDDYNGQAAYLSVASPKGLIVRVGW